MSEMVTETLKAKEVFKADMLKGLADKYGFDADEAQFVRKGLVPSDLQFEDGERASIDYITTKDVDRDGDIVDPMGVILDDYRKNPVVLWAHKYDEIPLGKNIWIKADENGLIAKTQYANHKKADDVWNYRKDGFPLGKSVGFIPLEIERVENNGQHGEAKRVFKRWLMLEYSDTPVPMNQNAIGIAVNKGLITQEEAKSYMPENIKETKSVVDDCEADIDTKEENVSATTDKDISVEYIEEKAGRVLSKANRKKVQDAIDALNMVLAADSKDEEDKCAEGVEEKSVDDQVIDDEIVFDAEDEVEEKEIEIDEAKIAEIASMAAAKEFEKLDLSEIVDQAFKRAVGRVQ